MSCNVWGVAAPPGEEAWGAGVAGGRGGSAPRYNSDMSTADLASRISVDPAICGGRPCIRGHRIWVSLILDRLAAGETVDDLIADYPGIDRDDVLACIAYGADMSRTETREAR